MIGEQNGAAGMWLGTKALLQCRDDARLAEPGFAGDQHYLAVACLARSQRRSSSSISSSRPTNGVSVVRRSASNRPATTLRP